jgi:dTDP-4-dehydrorhamnose reductase
LQTGQFGLYHLTNSDACSWYELAKTIFELEGIDAELAAIPSRDYPTAARRPSYSVLASAGYTGLRLPPMRPWQEALAAYLQERRKNSV